MRNVATSQSLPKFHNGRVVPAARLNEFVGGMTVDIDQTLHHLWCERRIEAPADDLVAVGEFAEIPLDFVEVNLVARMTDQQPFLDPAVDLLALKLLGPRFACVRPTQHVIRPQHFPIVIIELVNQRRKHEAPARKVVAAAKVDGTPAELPLLDERFAAAAGPKFWTDGLLIAADDHVGVVPQEHIQKARILFGAVGLRFVLVEPDRDPQIRIRFRPRISTEMIVLRNGAGLAAPALHFALSPGALAERAGMFLDIDAANKREQPIVDDFPRQHRFHCPSSPVAFLFPDLAAISAGRRDADRQRLQATAVTGFQLLMTVAVAVLPGVQLVFDDKGRVQTIELPPVGAECLDEAVVLFQDDGIRANEAQSL